MRGCSSRDLFSIALLAVAITAGFSMLVNRWCDRAYAANAAVFETMSDELRNEPDTGALTTLRQRAATILSRVDVSSNISNESAVFERLMELGEKSGVRIDRVDPVRTAGRDTDEGEIRSYGAKIVAVGSYEAFARFVNSIESNISYSTVIRFDLTLVSTHGEDLVRGSVETRHLHLDEDTLEMVASVDGEVE